MKTYKRLLSYVRPHANILGLAIVFMFLTSLFAASPVIMIIPLVDRIMADNLIVVPDYERIPVFVTDIINWINVQPRLVVLNFILLAGLIMVILRSFFEYFYTYFMSDTSHRVTRELRSELYDKLISMPLSYFSKARTGVLVSRITYDTGVVRDAISEGVKDLLFQPLELFWFTVTLLVIRSVFSIPWIFIVIIIFVLPLVVYPVIRLGQVLKKISHQSQEQMANIHTTLFESLSGVRVVKAFGMEDYESKRFRFFSWSFYKTRMRSISRMLLMRPITDCVIVVCSCAVAWLGGRQIVYEGMSPGAFLAFLVALFSLFKPFKRLSRLHSINQTALAAAERIFEVLDAQEDIREVDHPIYLSKIRDNIEFRDIWFSYEADRPILKGVNLKIQAGEIVAIVGPSGVGKTTLVNLLPRFYDPEEGSVFIDGQPLREANIKSLRQQIGIVTQETVLFNDTIIANIAYGQSGISHSVIEKTAQDANAHDFIQRLPNGYQTIVGDRGFKLSGGEKQRIAIARALLKNAPILILDEATSALDTESETLVQKAIQRLMIGRTVLVIAHRISTIKNASRIVVLDDGKIIEQGRHEELLNQNGFYKRIYQMQFQA